MKLITGRKIKMRIVAVITAVTLISLQLLTGAIAAASGGEAGSQAYNLSRLVAGNNEFAFAMYQKIYSGDKSNIFFSPLSISTALGMTYAGAGGNTERQMAGVLRFNLPQTELHAAFADLAGKLKAATSDQCRLDVANALWGQAGVCLQG